MLQEGGSSGWRMTARSQPGLQWKPSHFQEVEKPMRRVVAILLLSACLASVPTLADDFYFVPTPIAPSPVVSYYSAPVASRAQEEEAVPVVL